MSHFLFEQLQFVRQGTLHIIKDISETQADIVPEGFNNNIRWNLGHIYLVHALFSQDRAPSGYGSLFKMGSKPADWTVQPPALPELLELLEAQPNRIQEQLLDRLDESLPYPSYDRFQTHFKNDRGMSYFCPISRRRASTGD